MAQNTEPMSDTADKLRSDMQRVDSIMALEGFERSEGMRALDEAMLAGRASMGEVASFLLLQAKLVGAESVLKQIGQGDERHSVIEERSKQQQEELRRMAIAMGGAVRVAFDL